MAVAGTPDFSRPFFGESEKRESGSRWDDENFRRSTRASALLQMWREIEGENVLSRSYRSRQHRNVSDSECRSTSTSIVGVDGSENGDVFSQVSDESENHGFGGSEASEIGEDDNSVISEQSSDLGRIERERVRQIFQEWINNCPKGHPSSGFKRKNRSGHCVGHIEAERVRVLRERSQITTQRSSDFASYRGGVRPQIEQVCDGVVISHPEIRAKKPLRRLCGRQTLIDLLLKAQNERKIELLSISELRPVSDFAHRNRIQALLRGRFLRNGRVTLDERPSSVAATELGVLRQRQTVSDLRDGFLSKLDNSSISDGNSGGSASTGTAGGATRNHVAAYLEETTTDVNRNMQEHEVQTVEADLPFCSKSPSNAVEESSLAYIEREHVNVTFIRESLLESADINCSGPSDVYNENNESISGVSSAHDVDDHSTDLEGNTSEGFVTHGASVQIEESQAFETENEESVWQNGSRKDTDRCSRERSSQSLSGRSGIDVEEQDQMHESQDWPNNDFQEAIDSWLDMPTSEAGESVREAAVYFPYDDDDNGNSMELRELFSRRRVSSLLHSSFRESLNQVLQSHAERLSRASVDWETESASFPSVIDEDHEQLNGDHSQVPSESPFSQSSTPFEVSQQLWNEDFEGVEWPNHYSNQQMETWDVMNEFRSEMTKLQQRMNDMQCMLEACMDMQMELQRSLQQEVSAALNTSDTVHRCRCSHGRPYSS